MKTEYRFEAPDTTLVAITIRGTVRQFKELAKSLDASPFSYPGSILRDQIAAVVNQATSALGESKEGCGPMTGIKLEVGKRYVDREGRVYGPLFATKDKLFDFECRRTNESWTGYGDYYSDGEASAWDLIALVPDEAPEPLAVCRQCMNATEAACRKIGECVMSLRAENARLRKNSRDLWTAVTALLAWVDAVPSETPLPPMPGIDRDWVNEVVARAALTAKEPAR